LEIFRCVLKARVHIYVLNFADLPTTKARGGEGEPVAKLVYDGGQHMRKKAAVIDRRRKRRRLVAGVFKMR
jgi:hypothetical protein